MTSYEELAPVLISGNFCHMPSSKKFYILSGSAAAALVRKIHFTITNVENSYDSLMEFGRLTGLDVKIISLSNTVKIFLDREVFATYWFTDVEHAAKEAIRKLADKAVFKNMILRASKRNPMKFDGIVYD